jgi:hypothetical protein
MGEEYAMLFKRKSIILEKKKTTLLMNSRDLSSTISELLLQKIMKSSLSGRSSQATNRNGSSMAL